MDNWGAAGSFGDMNCIIANFPPASCKGFLSHFSPDSKAVVLRAKVSAGSETHTQARSVLKVAMP